ncbi:DUF2272 domain-containing protein [Elstera cyanobacteriorum]|uniref:DUF2272 domain-containing protein n=1 Tax=Elstera cyanobacteriorum TaxID=2022747 RepID=UPI0023541724|nr:DUF2272 domain-containing protein [Elstera cyanobacteriorum]MCK6441507.1 DUF2272 domain-containing protein [Elstera cyanobacteriorum]
MNFSLDGRPTPLACPVEDSPAARRLRLIATAQAEWQTFGGAVIDWSNGRKEILAEGIKETDDRVASDLRRYWRAVPTVFGENAAASDGKAAATDAPFSIAWSAAFISYLACAAGVPASDLPRAEAHFTYLDAALIGTPGFVAQPPEEDTPQPGDLICGDRSPPEKRLASLLDRRAEIGSPRPLHCDIVVDVRPRQLRAIGGNVNDTISLSLYPIDADGRLIRLTDPEALSWLAVLRSTYPAAPEMVSQK